MDNNFKGLMISQVDDALEAFRPAASSRRPASGWIKAIREAIGMTKAQLAQRVHLSPSTVNTLERSEARGAITIESLEKLARGMDCRLVYAIVPNGERTLEQLVREQAELVARNQHSRVAHTMRLEEQGLEDKPEKRQLKRIVDALLSGSRRALWR